MANNEKLMILIGAIGLMVAYLLGAHFIFQQIAQLASNVFTTTIASFEDSLMRLMYSGRDMQAASYSH